MESDAQVASVVKLLADRSRVAMLWALADGRAVPAAELARSAGIKPSTASTHLSRLLEGGLVEAESSGRLRLFRLTRPAETVAAMECLARLAPPAPAGSFREGREATRIREARTCYDHLAGRLAVLMAQGLEERGLLRQESGAYVLGPDSGAFFQSLGIDIEKAKARRRSFARACMDWSEKRHHLAGALGAALLERMLDLGWIERLPATRAVLISRTGRQALREVFGVDGTG